MDATEKSDQRREEEAEGEEEEAEESSAEGTGDVRVLTSVDLRLAMIPGFTEYTKDFEANKRRTLYGLKEKPGK